MLRKSLSGQFLFFDLVSVLSGYAVTGFSGSISGRKLMDSAAMAVLSGNIVEVSGGMYRANLYDWDTSGDNIGYFFTASGCVPRSFNVVTVDSTSGRLWPASGVSVNVYSGQLSGQPITLLSGRSYPASGVNAVVPPASLSGIVPDVLSGTVFLASGSITSGVIRSGIFVTATATINSGETYLASGHSLFWSGLVYLASGSVTSGVISSGIFVSVPPASLSGVVANSGLNVTVPIATISGAVPNVLSGTVFLASGSVTSGVISSGVFVTASLGSGTTYLASGHSLFWSGLVYLNSGQLVNVFSGQLSGHGVDLLSGRSFTASGINAVTTISSGTTYLASGHSLFWSGLIYLNSGQLVNVFSGQLSGHTPNLLSGFSFLGSGNQVVAAVVSDKSGYTLTRSGLDTIQVESGMNLRQAASIMAAALGGRLSGAGTTSILIDAANASGTNRIDATVTASGNRTAVTLSLPT